MNKIIKKMTKDERYEVTLVRTLDRKLIYSIQTLDRGKGNKIETRIIR